MSNTLNKLNILPSNKTVVFYSPIEGDYVLVRSGTLESENSFFHALAYGIYKDYYNMNETEKKDFVNKIKKNIFSKYLSEHISVKFKSEFEKKIMFITENLYKFIRSEHNARGKTTKKVIKKLIDTNDKLQYFNVITDLLPFETLNNIFIDSFNVSITTDDYTNIITKNTLKHFSDIKEIHKLDTDINKTFQTLIENMIFEIIKQSKNVILTNNVDTFIKTLEINKENIEIISKYFKRDIYFISSKNRIPYDLYSENIENKNKSIIIMTITDDSDDKTHYEIVGRLHTGNKVQREFNSDDIIINKIYEFICNPLEINKKYPELEEYIITTNNRNINRSRSINKSPAEDDYDDDENFQL